MPTMRISLTIIAEVLALFDVKDQSPTAPDSKCESGLNANQWSESRIPIEPLENFYSVFFVSLN